MTLERMTVPIEWKAGGSPNTLIGYASTFGNVDHGGDVVMPGAFTNTLKALKANGGIPLLADHMATTASVLGTITDGHEDAHGLVIEATLSKAPSAQDTAIKLREGHLSKLSIGYESMDDAMEDRGGMRVRLLRDVKLWETSVVVFPMNPQAAVSTVKGLLDRFVDEGVATVEDFTRPAAPALKTLDVWRIEYDVEARTGGVPSKQDTPAPAGPTEPPAGAQQDPAPDDGAEEQAAPVAAAPSDEDGTPEKGDTGHWDRWTSQALLHNRPLGDVDDVTRAALRTRLELAEAYPNNEPERPLL